MALSKQQIITRKEAINSGLNYYFTGLPCKNNHISKRNIRGNCLQCLDEYRKTYVNKTNAKEYARQYYLNNKEELNKKKKIYRDNNNEKIILKRKEYYDKNKESILSHNSLYIKENPHIRCANSAKRRAMQLQRTPKWSNNLMIKEIYTFAAEFREYGIDVHVDHILPLLGKKVSGLHVPDNLRVCLASVNLKKGNRI